MGVFGYTYKKRICGLVFYRGIGQYAMIVQVLRYLPERYDRREMILEIINGYGESFKRMYESFTGKKTFRERAKEFFTAFANTLIVSFWLLVLFPLTLIPVTIDFEIMECEPEALKKAMKEKNK